MNETMFFSFEHPIKFERSFDYERSNMALNNYWFEDSSNPEIIKQFKYDTKETLVKRLKISPVFDKDKRGKDRYLVTLIGVANSEDAFYVPVNLFSNFLKEFELL